MTKRTRIGRGKGLEMAKVATVRVRVDKVSTSKQQALDGGINAFGIDLLAESLGDGGKLDSGGIMFIWPFDHKNRPVWVIVTGQAPFIEEVEEAKVGE